jgi:hypothetical protein
MSPSALSAMTSLPPMCNCSPATIWTGAGKVADSAAAAAKAAERIIATQ